MAINQKFKTSFVVGTAVIILITAVGLWQFVTLRKAHSTFENYYAFRGCIQLVSRAESYGYCKLRNGQTVKIVEFRGQWYLDGDLPMCWKNICI